MSEHVFVVQEAPTGRWTANCCDPRCPELPGCWGEGAHMLADSPSKTVADAAATRHRKLLRTLPVPEETRRSDICEHCGQSEKANEQLRQLVAELEARLARYESKGAA